MNVNNTIELGVHVKAVLDAIAWMGEASFKLSEIDVVCSMCPEVDQRLDGIKGPAGSNAGDLVGALAWVAADLMRICQEQQKVGAV
ncbi:MAG: hypothetical protein CVU21_22340 [Betaproteobacteria bacterium HGW-Betaproteobacteria-15]|nr:MAG: hypothetical protein CVU21_22340 [Betaproteobacteria bacterium HGW-Betaproteobacteria-15]